MVWDPLILSFRVAAIATVFTVVIGVAIGALLASRRVWGRDLIDAIVSAPLVLPPTVLGYYLIVAVGRDSAIGGAWRTLTGHDIVFTVTGAVVAATVGSLPMVVKAARAALEGVDPTLPAAARTLGAGPVRAFFTVTLPLASTGIVAGAMLAFARALGDFGITMMVAGDMPGHTQTASLYIYDEAVAGRDRSAAIMSLVTTLFAVTILYAVNVLTRRRLG